METVSFLPYAEILWQEDIKAIRVVWKKQHMKLGQFEEIIERAWSILKEGQGFIWVSDMYRSEGVFPQEIKDFISSAEVAVKSTSMGVRWALTIMPKSVGLASMSTKSWNTEVKKKDTFVVEEFPDWDTCKNWIQNQLSQQ